MTAHQWRVTKDTNQILKILLHRRYEFFIIGTSYPIDLGTLILGRACTPVQGVGYLGKVLHPFSLEIHAIG